MSAKMKVSVCFLALLSCCVALPADIFPSIPEELDLSKLKPGAIYLEPIQSVNEVPSGRIIGGTEVTPHSAPHHVAIITSAYILCGASLISPTRVLTAAHCIIDAAYVQVRAGAHAFNSNEATQIILTSASIIYHANYNQGAFAANDIGVILLPSAIPLSNAIATIPLAPANSGTFAGQTARFTGWGRTNEHVNSTSPVLLGIDLNVISNAVCALTFGSNVSTSSICTSGAGNVGPCGGDSGSALTLNGIQIGIASFTTVACAAGNPTVYTRISSYRNWVTENAGV